MSGNPANYPTNIRITKVDWVALKVDFPSSTVNSQAKVVTYPDAKLEMG